MKITSTKYPELRVAGIGVKFHEGEAEVTDKAAIEKLRTLADIGVEVPDADSKSETKATSKTDKKSASESKSGAEENPPVEPKRSEGEGSPDAEELASWGEDALREFATAREIDLGKLQNLDKIRERIAEALDA